MIIINSLSSTLCQTRRTVVRVEKNAPPEQRRHSRELRPAGDDDLRWSIRAKGASCTLKRGCQSYVRTSVHDDDIRCCTSLTRTI
jgi:hypothetical protein